MYIECLIAGHKYASSGYYIDFDISPTSPPVVENVHDDDDDADYMKATMAHEHYGN